MVTKSYVNAVREDEVSLAIEKFIIAPYPTTFTPARIDLTPGALPTGFYDLGAVVEDTPSLTISKELFTLSTGIPAIRQYEVLTGLDGTVEFSLHSSSWRKLQVALGNYTAVSSATLLASVLSVTNANVFTFTATLTSAMTVGDQVTIARTSTLNDIDQPETVIRSIVSKTDSLLSVYCVPAFPLGSSPSTAYNLYSYPYIEQTYGSAIQREFTLLGVADLLDGTQIVQEFYRCRPAGEFTREITPEQNVIIPLTFNLFGVNKTVRGAQQLVLAREFYFPAVYSAQ